MDAVLTRVLGWVFAVAALLFLAGLSVLIWLFGRGTRMKKLLTLLVLLAACATVTVEPYRAERLNPPAWYRHIYQDVLECLRERGGKIERQSYGSIRWFVARPGVMGEYGEVPAWSGEVAGKWSWPDVIVLDARFVGHLAVLRHELAHYILQEGATAHPLVELCEFPNPGES